MLAWIKQYNAAKPQTKYFILTWIVYSIAIIWTSVQAYARLEYSRTQFQAPSGIEASAKK